CRLRVMLVNLLLTPPLQPSTHDLSLHDALPISCRAPSTNWTGFVKKSNGSTKTPPPSTIGLTSRPRPPQIKDTHRDHRHTHTRRSEEHTSELQSRFDLV